MGNLTIGVPQGSVLGANLFLIYINDLCSARFNGNIYSFADDTAFSYANSNLRITENQINSDLRSLKWWFTKNKMVLSPEKTVYVNFSLRVKHQFVDKIIYPCIDCLCSTQECLSKCSEICQSDKVKYLGLILDRELTWKDHKKP